MKNYIGFVNDHSGSMGHLAIAARNDYNANITAVKDAASREMLDTIVSVVGVGVGRAPSGRTGCGTARQVVVSNPHVLKPITSWDTSGGTPLYDGIGDMIELMRSVPDYNRPDVSFLLMITTDGEEMHSEKYTAHRIRNLIGEVSREGRWTIVFRVPKGMTRTVSDLGVPLGNIQEWETTTAGMAASTQATTEAVNAFYSTRASGQRSSGSFYANAAGVTAKEVKATLEDISAKVELIVVPAADNGAEIRPFVERFLRGKEFLKGAAFYQLTKTEARVQDTKLILIRDRLNGRVYHGPAARQMIGLSTVGTVRLHPGDHGQYDIFIQSTSVNRKLVAGTGVIYWAGIGTQFKPEDLAYLNPVNAAAQVAATKPAQPTGVGVTQLAAVAPTNKPTKSPLTPTPRLPAKPQPIVPSDGGRVRYYTAPAGAVFYSTRDMARAQAMVQGKKQYDAGPTAPKSARFYIA